MRAFWTLPLHRDIQYADDRQYEEQARELFRDAVLARIGGNESVCAELSGGLDSSSVVCMADRLRKETGGEKIGLTTFSYTHEKCTDEKYFREVERFCGLSGCHLDLRDGPAVTADQTAVTPAWWEPRFRALAQRMAAIGAGVLMTGQLGDLTMGNLPDDSGQVADWLSKGRFAMAAREAYAWAYAMQVPVYPIFWRSMREAWFSWVPPVSPRAAVGAITASTEDSLAPGLSAPLELHEQERRDDAFWKQAPPGKRRRMRAAGEMLHSRSLQAPEALQHVSYTHPYTHRPLVEFMLAIPAHIAFAPNQPRRLMRLAFAGMLPPLVLNRKSKAAYTSTYMQALQPLAATLLHEPNRIQLVERGFLDHKSLIGRLERFTQGLDCNESQLRQILVFEFWLRNRMAPQAPALSPPQLAVP